MEGTCLVGSSRPCSAAFARWHMEEYTLGRSTNPRWGNRGRSPMSKACLPPPAMNVGDSQECTAAVAGPAHGHCSGAD